MNVQYTMLERRDSEFKIWTLIILIYVLLYLLLKSRPFSNFESKTRPPLVMTISHPNIQTSTLSLDPDLSLDIGTILNITRPANYGDLPECEADNSQISSNFSNTFVVFKECMLTHMKSYSKYYGLIDDTWEKRSKQCERLLNSEDVTVQELKNDTKWAVLPKCKEEHQLVTLGVARNVQAEREIEQILPDVNLHGSDPIVNPNQQLFSPIGKFFPFAVGKKTGTYLQRVMTGYKKEEYQDVTTLEMVYFFKEVLNLPVIDFLWISTEGSEYQLFDYFLKDGPLYKESLIVCQINMEIHPTIVENGFALLKGFIVKLAEEEKFLLTRGRIKEPGVYRMLLLNVQEPKCVNKYLL